MAARAHGVPTTVTLYSVTKKQWFITNEDDRVLFNAGPDCLRGDEHGGRQKRIRRRRHLLMRMGSRAGRRQLATAPHRHPYGAACLVAVIAALLLVGPAGAGAGAGLGTRSHPYKRGAVVKMKDGFWIRVVSVDRHAWPRLESQSRSNRPPPPAETYVLVTIRASNHGKTEGLPFVDGLLEAVGPSRANYNPFEQGCGVIPSDVGSIGAISPGASAVAHACWKVQRSDAASLLMYYKPYVGSRSLFFALR